MKDKYFKNVATLNLDSGKCTGCGICIDVCPHGVFLLINSQSKIVAKDQCMECGACANNCPFFAISVQSGVGCANAIIKGKVSSSNPNCSSSEDNGCCC